MSDLDKVKKLRESTGLSFNEIKKALDESAGDEAKALEALQQLGVSMAAKRASREVKEGVISVYVHSTKKLGAMVELLCETDFVARNSEFQALAYDLALHTAALKPTNLEELLAQEFIKDPSKTIRDIINQSVAKLGENIQVGRFTIFEI